MEDDNGLDLRLGLSCGNSSTTSRATNGSSFENRPQEIDRGCKQIDDFRNFLQSRTAKCDSVKPEENFFNNLSTEADERKRVELVSNSMYVFDDITQVKKMQNRDFETQIISHIRANASDQQPTVDDDHDQAIKAGIAADVKLFGSSVPDLPWVSTKGSDRTISGVTYRVNTTQVRIVCACHGWHMSPQEFVMHANELEHQTMQGDASACHRFF